MKRLIVALLLPIFSAAWLYFTFYHYEGLNSIQRLASYCQGIAAVRTLPVSGTLVVRGIPADAQIIVDTLGIPQVYARDPNSAAFALGYMHARDRYFQMELMASTMMGRLSEIVGPGGLGSDKRWRGFGLEARAAGMLDSVRAVEPGLYAYLEAYAKGVNAYVSREDSRHRDPLYTLWDREPGEWKPYYAFLIQWYMSSELSYYDDYVNREELLDKLPKAVRAALYPANTDGHHTIIPAPEGPPLRKGQEETGRRLARLFEKDRSNRYEGLPFDGSLGSNNWVVGKERSKDGALFLCNDLHLRLVSPNVFYEVQLHCPGLHVYGFTIPGAPLVVTGHNESIAWGITNGEWDVTEQYALRTDPGDKEKYLYDGHWETMTKKAFQLNVKNGSPERLTVAYSVFGPVVRKDSIVYGLCWHPANGGWAIRSFWKLMRASDWTGFRDALREYDYPAQNFVYADTGGHIGMICAGKMPLKPAGYSGGLLDGTRPALTGFVPFDSLPQVYDPVRHYLLSANQEPCVGPYYYSSRWVGDLYRPERIEELLKDSVTLTEEDMRKMQLDITDISIGDVKRLLTRYKDSLSLNADWKGLDGWDGRLKAGSPQTEFFRCFREAFRRTGRDLARKMGVRATPSFGQLMNFLLHYDSLSLDGKPFYSRDCVRRLIDTTEQLYAGVTSGKNRVPEMGAFIIPQMTFLPGLDREVRGTGGDDNTINVNYGAHPVIRTLIELKAGAITSRMVNAIGQTGRLNDPNYFQQLSDWKGNRLHRTQFAGDAGSIHAVAYTIELTTADQP